MRSCSCSVKRQLFSPIQKCVVGLLTCSLLAVIFLCSDPHTVGRLLGKIPYFRVEEVKFSGQHRMSSADLYRQTGILRYQNSLFSVDADVVAARLEDLIWVEKASVSFDWPSTVNIRIKEQVPVALVHTPGEKETFFYLSKSGDIFSSPRSGDSLDFPIITGIHLLEDEAFEQALKNVVLFMDKVVHNNPNLPVHAISEIYVDEQGELTLFLVDYSFPIYIGSTSVGKAYKYLVRILADIYNHPRRNSIAKIGYIQLDYMKDRVLVAESESS
ncbi:related to cell division protein FtsQ [Desulfotalea psychrophila LSv54]|uniref:Related to cell division protein FtsQ n=2 Tax=Desulfotalea psychrophila TaxID=84980 RepID=Q6AJ56_DESPS|nr:related to cell division protein FtsQ [Desulfotalea psychrophila LSv54]